MIYSKLRGFVAATVVAGALAAGSVNAGAQENAEQPGPMVDLYSEADAAAVLNARLVALKTVLELTADQEKLWPPVEEAIRTMAKDAAARGAERAAAGPPMDFLDVMERIADAEQVRAQALKAFVAAARRFVASLTEEQKRRAPSFLGMKDDADRPQPTLELWFFEDEEG